MDTWLGYYRELNSMQPLFSKADFIRKIDRSDKLLHRVKLNLGESQHFPQSAVLPVKESEQTKVWKCKKYRQRQKNKLEAEIEAFIQADKFVSFEELSTNCQCMDLPSNVYLAKEQEYLLHVGLSWEGLVPPRYAPGS